MVGRGEGTVFRKKKVEIVEDLGLGWGGGGRIEGEP